MVRIMESALMRYGLVSRGSTTSSMKPISAAVRGTPGNAASRSEPDVGIYLRETQGVMPSARRTTLHRHPDLE